MTYTAPLIPAPKPTNGLAVAALVLGIVGAVLSLAPVVNVVAAVLAVLAIVFGIIGLTRAKRLGVGRGRAIAGLILAVGTLVLVPTVNAAFFNATDLETPTAAEQPVVEEEPEPAAKEPVAEPETEEPAEPEFTVAQEQAIISADSYLSMGGFSRSGLIGQLEYEGFSTDDATYAVDLIAPDWNNQAAMSAASYMEMGGFSAQSLLDQLLYEGFTQDEAEHGVGSVGF